MANAGKPTALPLTPAANVPMANGGGGGGGPDDLYQALQDLAKELSVPYDFKSDSASLTAAVRECIGAVQKIKGTSASGGASGKGSADGKYPAPSANGQSSSATPSPGPTPLELAVSYDFDQAKENANKPKEERIKSFYWKEADSVYLLLGEEKAEENLAEQLCGLRCRLGVLIKEARANAKTNKNLAYGLQRVLNGPQPKDKDGKDDRTQADCKKYAASKRTDPKRVGTAAGDLQNVAAKFALCTDDQSGEKLWAAATGIVPAQPTTPDVPKEKKKKSHCTTVCDCAK